MSKWTFEKNPGSDLGRFQVVISAPSGKQVDVSYFRGVPVQIEQYSFGDPFSDAAAVLTFPQITGLDDLHSVDVGSWLQDYSSVDIYWLSSTTGEGEIDPRTNQPTREPSGARTRIWEGFIASHEVGEGGYTVQCQGALFQLDRYLAKPMFPPRPLPHEALMTEAFDPVRRPHLRTRPLVVRWPLGWTKKAPAFTPGLESVLIPVVTPGSSYTGYATRQTGNWDRVLTSYIQDLLAVMFVDDASGVTPGNQWTILKEPLRTPVLQVRDRFKPVDFSVWFGQVGVKTPGFTRDTTQSANIIFGEGSDTAGTTWRNAVISSDGSRTDYAPLASTKAVWPYTRNPLLNKNEFAAETFYKYGSGFDADSAAISAGKSLSRDADPGWTGTLTLSVDPAELSRWQVRAGMTMRLRGFMGTGEQGMRFHVAEVTAKPMTGEVEMTLDTRYRDLLTIEEARVRTRDALTPSKMLQVNRRSAIVEDAMAPWDYTAGSGFIPTASINLHRQRTSSDVFPWQELLHKYPPLAYGHYYVKVNADKPSRYERWTLGKDVPIIMAQNGTIRRLEIVACDVEGNILPVPFHFSLYYVPYDPQAMPRDAAGPSPWIPGAFESRQANGAEWPAGNYFQPPPHMINGWGNAAQPAGYSPGRFSDGNPPTGQLVDEGTFTFDVTSTRYLWNAQARPGERQNASSFTCYGAFYAEWPVPVYFIGRMYRAEPGT